MSNNLFASQLQYLDQHSMKRLPEEDYQSAIET